jgi:ATP-dependent DNA helicase DinG
VICDPRLLGKPYGRRILASLPPMRLVRELDEAVLFLKRNSEAPGRSAVSGRAD